MLSIIKKLKITGVFSSTGVLIPAIIHNYCQHISLSQPPDSFHKNMKIFTLAIHCLFIYLYETEGPA